MITSEILKLLKKNAWKVFHGRKKKSSNSSKAEIVWIPGHIEKDEDSIIFSLNYHS